MNNIITSEQVKVYNNGMSAQIAQTEAIAKNAGLADLRTWSFSQIAFANTIVKKGLEDGKPINNLYLQKLMYFVYGYALVRNNVKIESTLFQPWDMGPVVANTFQVMLGFGASPITEYCKEFDPTDFFLKSFTVTRDNVELHKIIDEVWVNYRKLRLSDIESEVKQPGGAWHKARIAHKAHLDIADIREDFIKLAK